MLQLKIAVFQHSKSYIASFWQYQYSILGAALGPLLAGLISPSGWNNVFYMLMVADACALLVSLKTLLGCYVFSLC